MAVDKTLGQQTDASPLPNSFLLYDAPEGTVVGLMISTAGYVPIEMVGTIDTLDARLDLLGCDLVSDSFGERMAYRESLVEGIEDAQVEDIRRGRRCLNAPIRRSRRPELAILECRTSQPSSGFSGWARHAGCAATRARPKLSNFVGFDPMRSGQVLHMPLPTVSPSEVPPDKASGDKATEDRAADDRASGDPVRHVLDLAINGAIRGTRPGLTVADLIDGAHGSRAVLMAAFVEIEKMESRVHKPELAAAAASLQNARRAIEDARSRSPLIDLTIDGAAAGQGRAGQRLRAR